MKINKNYSFDRRLVHRTGLAIEQHTLRREHEAARVVSFVFVLAFLIILVAGCWRLGMAQ